MPTLVLAKDVAIRSSRLAKYRCQNYVVIMPRIARKQLNIRSDYAHGRAGEIARQTGMTTTQVVEEALRGYTPPPSAKPAGRLVRKGRLLVMSGGREVTMEETLAAIDAVREERGDLLTR